MKDKCKFACPYCENEYRAIFTLKAHVREKHAKTCPVCGYEGENIKSHISRRKDSAHLVYAFLVLHKRTTDNKITDKCEIMEAIRL